VHYNFLGEEYLCKNQHNSARDPIPSPACSVLNPAVAQITLILAEVQYHSLNPDHLRK